MNSTIEKKTESKPSQSNGEPRNRYLTPPANIHEDADGYVIEAEMPGVNKEGLSVTVENGELVIMGRRKAEEIAGTAVYRESRGADFRRAFELDPSIDTRKITAKMDQGVLTLRLPKAESVKPRQIKVD